GCSWQRVCASQQATEVEIKQLKTELNRNKQWCYGLGITMLSLFVGYGIWTQREKLQKIYIYLSVGK
ncbi:18671_t:CDS:1, partial [Racocetra persica]